MDFVGYIQYDLKQGANLDVSDKEAYEIINSMESAMKQDKVKKISIADGTVFRSMGWKSKKGNVMRTKNPILKLGKSVEGFLVNAQSKDYEIEYVFLKDCGNLCLQDVKAEVPPKAEYVPRPREEIQPPRVETPPPQDEPLAPPVIVSNYYQPSPQEDYAFYGASATWAPFAYNGMNYYGWLQPGLAIPIPVYYETGDDKWCFIQRDFSKTSFHRLSP